MWRAHISEDLEGMVGSLGSAGAVKGIAYLRPLQLSELRESDFLYYNSVSCVILVSNH